MQFELILGFVLIMFCTKVYNRIVLLYAKYVLLYNKIRAAISRSDSSAYIITHDGADYISMEDRPASSFLAGIVDKDVYWMKSLTPGSTTVYSGMSSWDISVSGLTCRQLLQTSSGWIARYYGTYSGTPSVHFVTYNSSFVSTGTLTLPSLNNIVAFADNNMLGFDGTYLYLGKSVDTILKVNFSSGSYSTVDSLFGFVWGVDFYAICGDFLKTPLGKKIYLSPLHTYSSRNPQYPYLRYNHQYEESIYFDGYYVYFPLLNQKSTGIYKCGYIAKQILAIP